MIWNRGLVFDAESGAGGGAGGDSSQGNGGETPDFETWLGGQGDEVKTLIDGHVKGLKSALTSERETRSKLERDLRELAGKAEKDSDSQKRLTEMADQIAESDRKADFYESAHAAGVTNLKLAYLVATQDGLFDRRGQINFEAMKQQYPELFGAKQTPRGNAGAGTDNNRPENFSMNDFIRKAAGR